MAGSRLSGRGDRNDQTNAIECSQSNDILTTYFPDLWFALTMVAGAAYLKNFGASADDPRMAMSWETHVQPLLQSAKTEEQMKKYRSQAWTSEEPTIIAKPPRA